MIERELSELPKSALRDYAGDARVERVWHRLESERSGPAIAARWGLLWAPAFGVCLFVGGVLVGRGMTRETSRAPQMVAESRPATSVAESVTAPVSRVPEQPSVPSAAPPTRLPSTRPSVRGEGSRAALVEPFSPASSAQSAPLEPPDWERLADSGDFAGARAALGRVGGVEVALSSASPEQLMTLADLLRASGGREQAVRALRRLVEVFPGAPEAPLAAWTLGNLLDQGGDPAGAADAYALYRRLSPAGDFVEDAAARQVDVALSQRDVELASRLVEQYAKDFPNGGRFAEFRDELEKLLAESLDAGVRPSELPVVGSPALPTPPAP